MSGVAFTNCMSESPCGQMDSSSLRSTRHCGNGRESEVWKRQEQVFDLRTELSFQAIHSERRYTTTTSVTRWVTSVLDRIVSGNTARSSNV